MILLSKLLPVLVFPLGLSIEMILGGLVCLWLGRKKTAFVLFLLSLTVLFFFSSGPVRTSLVKSLEREYLPVPEAGLHADAIVALGGGGRPNIYPRNHAEFNEGGERIFHSIRLFKAGAAPYVIASGGGIDFILKGQKEAEDMKELMVEFGMPADRVLVESRSKNTHDNALFVKKTLEEHGLGMNIILVTSAMHMKRSVAIFKKAGFTVMPAPTDYLVEDRGGALWFDILPSVYNLEGSTSAIKEYIGIATYKMLGWL
ncbi:MAG: YdcF family protein [Fibrobacterota bacterium]